MIAFLRAIATVERVLLASIMIAMTLLYSGAVLVREVSDELYRELAWVDEATRWLMVWMVFLGLGLALEQGKHVAMTSLLATFSQGTRRMVRRAIDLVGLLFSLAIVWFGWDITRLVLGTGQVSPTLGLTTAILYLALPVGFGLLALRYLAGLLGIQERALEHEHPERPS
ncbi:TRAP transporter small permease [Salinarimonas ramus]|uniref:TRAP transporter small permease protein n=1 Tax=Salinarimonas ramus TaxID=690164 RepID=A0A917V2F5_9HYPH|nr:TRAP transporter small permease [Salinarimonas ramus]GGK21423.1 C4-dicarboxylate ABC transporter permease [Salinarimonas ramus]